jgi:hypothetical protein
MQRDLLATGTLIKEFIFGIGQTHTLHTLRQVRTRVLGQGLLQTAEELEFYSQRELFELWMQLTQAGVSEHSCPSLREFYRVLGSELVRRSGERAEARKHASRILDMLTDCYSQYAEMPGLDSRTDTVH